MEKKKCPLCGGAGRLPDGKTIGWLQCHRCNGHGWVQAHNPRDIQPHESRNY